jgi:hypothetical protein
MSGYWPELFWEHSRRRLSHSDSYYSYFGVFQSYSMIFWSEFPRNENYMASVDSPHVGLSNGVVLGAFMRTFELFWHITAISVHFSHLIFFWRKFPQNNHYTARVDSLPVRTKTGTLLHAFPRTSEQFRHVLPLYYLYFSEYSVIFWVSLRKISVEPWLHGADLQSACWDMDRHHVACIPAGLGAILTCIISVFLLF